MAKYAINLTQTNVAMVQGKYLIPVGGWIEMRDDHASLEEVDEAVRRGWIKLALVAPKTVPESKPKFEFQSAPVHGSKEFPKDKKKKESV